MAIAEHRKEIFKEYKHRKRKEKVLSLFLSYFELIFYKIK